MQEVLRQELPQSRKLPLLNLLHHNQIIMRPHKRTTRLPPRSNPTLRSRNRRDKQFQRYILTFPQFLKAVWVEDVHFDQRVVGFFVFGDFQHTLLGLEEVVYFADLFVVCHELLLDGDHFYAEGLGV